MHLLVGGLGAHSSNTDKRIFLWGGGGGGGGGTDKRGGSSCGGVWGGGGGGGILPILISASSCVCKHRLCILPSSSYRVGGLCSISYICTFIAEDGLCLFTTTGGEGWEGGVDGN